MTIDEVKNNLRSQQFAKIIDLISEGPIRGVVNGLKGVYFDGTAVQATNGTLAYKNTSVQFVNGYPAQPIMKGFASSEAEEAVGLRLYYNVPITRSILNPDADRLRITLSVPALTHTDDTGDIYGSGVEYRLEIAPSGKPYQVFGPTNIYGKTTSRYQRAHIFKLPGIGPWTFKVTRLTADSTSSFVQNDLYFDSFTTIIDDRVNYTRSACVGITLDAEQFSSIPRRTYLTDGLLILIPKNYDPLKATYSGTWDGTFKQAWSNSPAWVFYDLIVNNRYGLGSFITPSMVDKWALYKVATWCDQRVNNGKGSSERRFTCNVQIMNQSEAFDLLGQIASIFRGFAYWAGGQLVAVADDPSDPVAQYSNANVIDGSFTYSGADMRARHTMASTAWADATVLGETRFAVAEDREQLSRWGIQQVDDPGIGSTSESQSLRTSKWALYTEKYESETVTFSTGLETAWVRPGDIIRVSDVTVSGSRMGGRIVNQIDPTHIVVDKRPPMVDGKLYYLSCIIPSGSTTTVVTRNAYLSVGPPANMMVISAPFAAAPLPDSVFVLNDPVSLQPTLWRVLSVKQTDSSRYEVSAVRHFPEKWAYVERDLAFADPDITSIGRKPPPVHNLSVREYMVQTSPISVGVRAVLSWTSNAPQFDVYWRKPPQNNWGHLRTDGQAQDLAVTEGKWQFRVTPISRIGVKGDAALISAEIIGRFKPPAEPKRFRVKISDGVALFEWLPATELDVIIGGRFELRHSSRTQGATWAGAQVVVKSIPGRASTVEAVYRTGTWFLRTFDIVGVPSAKVATIIALQPDGRYIEFVRICENPDFLGDRFYTEVLAPQQWLVLGQTGGLWDVQLADMDDWPDVDVLVEGMPDTPQSIARHGWYHFEDRIDAGGIFTVRFSADILAFPYAEGSEFVDDRLNNCDEWNDWDDVTADLSGQVELYIRTTNEDPAVARAAWSDWQLFAPTEYTARAFEFRADLYAPAGQNIGVEELCIIADLRMKMDSAEDRPYPAATTHVTFAIKFYLVPAVVLTVQNALATDTIQIINKTRQGFDVNITNAGVQVTRTFDWQARGF